MKNDLLAAPVYVPLTVVVDPDFVALVMTGAAVRTVSELTWIPRSPLSWIEFPTMRLSALSTSTPKPVFRAITSSGPMLLPPAPVTRTPSLFPSPVAPERVVPMTLPVTFVAVAPLR